MIDDIKVKINGGIEAMGESDVIHIPFSPNRVAELQTTYESATLIENKSVKNIRRYLNIADHFREALKVWKEKRDEWMKKNNIEPPKPKPTAPPKDPPKE